MYFRSQARLLDIHINYSRYDKVEDDDSQKSQSGDSTAEDIESEEPASEKAAR